MFYVTSSMTIAYVGLSLLCVVNGIFAPNVTVQSCTSRKLRVELRGGTDGGLMFIQGRGPECSRYTAMETSVYEFEFEACSLAYDTKFRLVVQEKPRVQRGTDTVTPIMCLVDTSELTVTGVIFPEESLAESVNKTVRPTVQMAMFADGTSMSRERIREVTLDDRVKLSVKLDEEFVGDFDIKAKDCMASLLPLVRDECSTDDQLFPNFEKLSIGDLASIFKAFQPTNLNGDPDVDITFTCNIAVCKGSCHTTMCDDVSTVRRLTRDAEERDDVTERVNVHTTLKVKARAGEALSVSQTTVCAERALFTTVSTCGLGILVVSWIFACCALSKLRRGSKTSNSSKPSTLRRLSEKNLNFARSVGRRLSTMLNIPVGYDMREPSMADWLPDQYTGSHPPFTKRRESVTVSISDEMTSRRESHVFISECVVRKRLVDACAQTEQSEVCDARECESVVCGSKRSDVSLKTMTIKNPILSLSIQSNSIKENTVKRDVTHDVTEFDLSLKGTDNLAFESHDDDVITAHSSDEFPKDISNNDNTTKDDSVFNGRALQNAIETGRPGRSGPTTHKALIGLMDKLCQDRFHTDRGPFRTVIDTRLDKDHNSAVTVKTEDVGGKLTVRESVDLAALGSDEDTIVLQTDREIFRRDSINV